MNTQHLNSVIKSCKPNEKLEINPISGEIRIIWNNEQGKKKSKKAGNLFNNDNTILPLPGKIWVTPVSGNAFKSYAQFGKKLSSTNKKSEIGENTLFEFFISFVDKTQQPNYFVDNNQYKYTVYECGKLKGYYIGENLRYIEKNGVKIYRQQKSPKLNTQKFPNLESVK